MERDVGVAGRGGVGLEVRKEDVWEGFGGAGRGRVGEGSEEVSEAGVCYMYLSVRLFSFFLLFLEGRGGTVPMNTSQARKYTGETRNARLVYPVPGDVHCCRAFMSP